jgi:hypothetical protein
MLSVPTLWTVFVINFLALGLIWAYVMRSYPAFEAARFWTASASTAAGGAAVAMLHFIADSRAPLLAGGTVLIFAALPRWASSGFTASRFRGARPLRSLD